MQRKVILMGLASMLMLVACASQVPVQQWFEPLVSARALPERVAVFIDASYIRRAADGQRYISVEDSMALAEVITDEVERALTGAEILPVLQRKYFISAYMRHEIMVAYRKGDDYVSRQPPVHMDPDVCRTGRMRTAMYNIWNRFAELAIAGEGACRSETIDVADTHLIASAYAADTLALAVVIVRKDDDTGAVESAPNLRMILTEQAGSAVVVGLVRASDGQIVYLGATSIRGPQRETYTRQAMKRAFSELPKREEGSPSYSVPTLPM